MKKNILFISTDQQHWTAMRYPTPEVKTPNLGRLVQSSTTFHRAYLIPEPHARMHDPDATTTKTC
jgi:arylsulfatase A-like enzyme